MAVDENLVRLEIDAKPVSRLRRLTDRPVTLSIDVRLEEERVGRMRKNCPGQAPAADSCPTRTKIKVAIGPSRRRDRRRDGLMDHAREILVSFRSYMMAGEDDSAEFSGAMARLKRVLTPWRA